MPLREREQKKQEHPKLTSHPHQSSTKKTEHLRAHQSFPSSIRTPKTQQLRPKLMKETELRKQSSVMNIVDMSSHQARSRALLEGSRAPSFI